MSRSLYPKYPHRTINTNANNNSVLPSRGLGNSSTSRYGSGTTGKVSTHDRRHSSSRASGPMKAVQVQSTSTSTPASRLHNPDSRTKLAMGRTPGSGKATARTPPNRFDRQRSASSGNIAALSELQVSDPGVHRDKRGPVTPPSYVPPSISTARGSAESLLQDNVKRQTQSSQHSSPSYTSATVGTGGRMSPARVRRHTGRQQSVSTTGDEGQHYSSRPSTPHRNSSARMVAALQWNDTGHSMRRSDSLPNIDDLQCGEAVDHQQHTRLSGRLQSGDATATFGRHASLHGSSQGTTQVQVDSSKGDLYQHANVGSPAQIEHTNRSQVGRQSPSSQRRARTQTDPTKAQHLDGGQRSLTSSPTDHTITSRRQSSPGSHPAGQGERPSQGTHRSISFRTGSRSPPVKDYSGYSSSTASWSTHTSSYYTRSPAFSEGCESGVVGLVNLGNTCFMNSMIQCLSHTHNMTKAMQRVSPPNPRGMAAVYKELMSKIWSTHTSTMVSPSALKSTFSREHPLFSGHNQQDSQEFMRLLIDSIHDELKTRSSAPRPKDDISRPGGHLQKAREYWEWFRDINSSPLADLFMGQLRSTLTCSACHHTSFTFDPFWDLQLPFPSKSSQAVSLLSCFHQFAVVEDLVKDVVHGVPFCQNCKACSDMTKRLTLERLPAILVIHMAPLVGVSLEGRQGRHTPYTYFFDLKRFCSFPRKKLHTSVQIPKRLDVGSFVSTDAPLSGATEYELYATSNHSGSAFYGHYTAFVKHHTSGEWYLCNDLSVSRCGGSHPISQPTFVSKEAYVLFYRRVSS